MFKMMLLLRRKPDLSLQDSIRYYEECHAPLAMDLTPRVFAEYRRNYVVPDGLYRTPHIGAGATLPDFDVITEIAFRSENEFRHMVAALADPEVGSLLRADEMKLFDTRPQAMVMMQVEQHSSIVR